VHSSPYYLCRDVVAFRIYATFTFCYSCCLGRVVFYYYTPSAFRSSFCHSPVRWALLRSARCWPGYWFWLTGIHHWRALLPIHTFSSFSVLLSAPPCAYRPLPSAGGDVPLLDAARTAVSFRGCGGPGFSVSGRAGWLLCSSCFGLRVNAEFLGSRFAVCGGGVGWLLRSAFHFAASVPPPSRISLLLRSGMPHAARYAVPLRTRCQPGLACHGVRTRTTPLLTAL